jgi:heavy metal sensor kinase
MTLTSRLLSFYLLALAVILLGFSAGLYVLARTYLYRQVDDRLETALDTLAAAAEIGPDGVEWEPQERILPLGQDSGEDQVRWLIRDDAAKVIDRSHNLGMQELPTQVGATTVAQDGAWQMARRTVLPTPGAFPPFTSLADWEHGKQPVLHKALVVTVAVSLNPVRATLRNLAVTMGALSVTLWVLAFVMGRWLCHRALMPVTRMAATAQSMDAADRTQRLPCPPTGDELESLGRAFNGLLDRLHEAFERQSRFTGDASHQLRTPLAAMIGQVEVALRRNRTSEEYARTLHAVAKEATHLRQITEMLLFLARADAEARLPQLETIDMAAWLPEKLAAWSGHVRQTDFRIEPAAPGPLLVKVHPPLLGQLVDNLLDNACKYSAAGTPIRLRMWGESDRAFLAVEDQGHGIAPDDLPHIFEPFYRSSLARRLGTAGVGLGLAVAARIAEAFGGSLTVTSEPGKVTCFTLSLPRQVLRG